MISILFSLLLEIDIFSNFKPQGKTESPISFKDDGIIICVSDEQWLKALFPIEVTEDGIAICVNNEHPLKALSSIEVTDGGIVICFIFVFFANKFLFIFFYF